MGKVTVTATIASKVDGDGNNIVEGLETLGPLSASYELTVLEPPVVTISAVGTIMLGDGGASIERDLSASYTLEANTPQEWIPAQGNLLSSFDWEFESGETYAEFVPGTENVSNTGASITLNAKSAGTVTVRGKLTLPGKVVTAKTTFTIIPYDRTQVPHQSITILNKFSEIIATDTKTISVSFTPAEALFTSIEIEDASNSNKFTITRVSQNEIKIKANAGITSEATYTIRAKSNVTGIDVKDEFTVNLKPLDVTVAVTGNVTELSKDGSATYTASVNANDNKNVSWSVTPATNVSMTGGVLKNTKSVTQNETVTVKATSQADTSRSGTKTVTLKPPKFTIKYDANNGSGTSTTETTVRTYGVPFNLAANTYTKTGYSFSGWSTTSSGSVFYTDGQQNVNNIDPPSNNAVVTLYAVWTLANYNIIYNNMTGAANHASNPAVYTYETNTITLQAPTRSGYNFGGWFSNANFTGAAVTQIAKGSTGDKTLYAKWESTVTIADANSADLMVKFGVKSAGYALSSISKTDVTNTFNTVKDYIATQSAADVNPAGGLGVIRLGDYVELSSINVSEYNGNGAVNITSNANDGKLRLMVVGINPYYGKNNNAATQHLVFHFKDFPGKGRMNESEINTGGYAASEMRNYLMSNYWPALQNAGVPDSAVWSVKRLGANDGVATGTNTIEDKLWLPTEWEIFGANTHSNSNYENSANQGRFGYYSSADSRRKSEVYLGASPSTEAYWWCGVENGASTKWIKPADSYGVAPAFAVSAADQPPASNIKTLTYNANGGSGSASQTVVAGASVKVRDGSGFTSTNYLFSGWNTQANGGAIYNAGDTISITQDTTLYAKWGVDLIYSANGGTGTPPANVSSQTATTVRLAEGTGLNKVDATMDGYTRYIYFDCWNTKADGSGVDLLAGASYTLNANVTLYAKYRYSDLMVTFNVKTLGYALSSITTQDVTSTFNKVSAYIKTQSPSSVNPSDGLGLIKLGDYVNLKSLNVAAYNSNPAVIITNTNAGDDKLRVMVVGINPYYNKNGNGTSTPHLIFHFKDSPGNARMEATDTNANGYLNSEMRTYITSKCWPALQTSGVPDAVVWNISRRVTNKGGSGASGTHTITDKLWLPTEREMFGRNTGSNSTHETDANQGRFFYYNSDAKRQKSYYYWLASPYATLTSAFCIVYYYGDANGMEASEPTYGGCAPAFAVK
ncbi:MAG: hypothetical protein Pg6A_14070 [Termitinemataceae bacterium]|nr:MAG: hypothetical protein Pg6A_14070 [Termitinemataceae bacterium]